MLCFSFRAVRVIVAILWSVLFTQDLLFSFFMLQYHALYLVVVFNILAALMVGFSNMAANYVTPGRI